MSVRIPVLPGFEDLASAAADVVMTPEWMARATVEFFQPHGRVLEPARGDGVFWRLMPGADWCEVREGRDFFEWRERVDWVVTNPPYSIFSDFLRHAMGVADNIVMLIPLNKLWNSAALVRDIDAWGEIRATLVFGGGKELGFPIGFCIGAVHLVRRRGPVGVHFYQGARG